MKPDNERVLRVLIIGDNKLAAETGKDWINGLSKKQKFT